MLFRSLWFQLRRELLVARLLDQLERREKVVKARSEAPPDLDLPAQGVGFAKGLLRGALVVPEVGSGGQRFQLGDATLLGVEVKDAPTSRGSVRPGPEWRRRPSVPRLEVLEEDRAELDEA